MTLHRTIVAAAALLVLGAPPARADIALPKGALADPGPVERRTGRVPATITVTPSGAANAPVHLIVTVPRDVLRDVMRFPPTAGRLGEVAPPPDGFESPAAPTRAWHVVAGIALSLALAALPLALRGRRRTLATAIVALVLGGVGGALVVGANILPGSGRALAALQSPPRTVEFVIVPGKGPVRVEARYTR